MAQVQFKSGATLRMSTTRQYDRLNRLSAIHATTNTSSTVVAGFAYRYSEANQRVRATLPDGSYWVYQYDKLGQVISGWLPAEYKGVCKDKKECDTPCCGKRVRLTP